MQAEILSDDELTELTGYCQRAARVRALDRLGIPFLPRPRDGMPLVARTAVVVVLSGHKTAPVAPAADEPRFDKVR